MKAPRFIHSLVLVAFVASAAADFGDPQVILLDWQEGRFEAGLLGVAPTAASSASWTVWIDDCHRRLRADLLYEPSNATAAVGPLTVEVPYDYELRAAGPNWSLETHVFSPGFDHFLGVATGHGLATVTIELQKGAAVDWSFRLRGWEVVGEAACVPVLLVNEVEANPAGVDVGSEWIELHNPGTFDVDAGGWAIQSTHGVVERMEIPPGTLVPRFGHAAITLPDQFLDNENESVVLSNPLGALVDATPIRNDTANDDRTWQRVPDGGTAWMFRTATRAAANA